MKHVLFAVPSAISVGLSAQTWKISASSEIELPKKSFADNIVRINPEEVCMVTTEGSGFMNYASPKTEDTYFNFYKNTTFQRSVNLKPKIEDSKYIEAFALNGKLYYTSMSYNKEKKQAEVHWNTIDNNGNCLKQTAINHGSFKPVVLNAVQYVCGNWTSPNKKKVLSILLSESEKETEFKIGYKDRFAMLLKPNKINIGVVNEDGTLFFNKDISLTAPAECERISIEDYDVNDQGDVFMIIKQYIEGKKEKVDGEVNYKLYLYILSNKGASTKKIPISTKTYFSPGPKIVVSNKGNIYCGGLLSEKLSGKFIGLYTMKLTAETDSFNYKITKINTEDINKYGSFVKYKEDEISRNFVLDRIVETDDHFGLVMEYFNAVTHTSSKGTYTTYYYRDIVYFMYDLNMNLKDVAVIPKAQITSGSTAYFSYSLVIHDNKPYFLFNDNKHNVGAEEEEKMDAAKGFKNLAPVMVYKEGDKWVRKRLFEKEEVDENILRTVRVEQVDNNTIFLPFDKKGNYVLGKLVFQ